MNVVHVKLSNIKMSNIESYVFNEYFTFKNNPHSDGIIIDCIVPDDINENYAKHHQSWLKYALDLALPNIVVSSYCTNEVYKYDWKSDIFLCYYGKTQYENKSVHLINNDILDHIKKWHEIIINYFTYVLQYEKGEFTSWDVAFNEYLDAMSCTYLEQSFMHLITALEALLVTGNNELNYRVSLNTSMLCGSNFDERKKIFNLIKDSYILRSSVVHGDANAIKKRLSKKELYDTMFELRAIVSKSLLLTFNQNKEKTLETIEKAIFT
jgi:hypothetical protein